MVTSTNGRSLIKKYEGLRTTAYKDAVGVLTIGYGHTAGVKAGMIITKAQAETFLSQDIAKCEKALAKYAKYNFNQNEWDSLVSFTFNLGTGNLDKLTANGTRTKEQIAEKILAYNKAGGKVLKGLDNRRKDEQKLFKTPVSKYVAMGVDYSPVFEPSFYATKYPDLKAMFGADAKGLFEHFLVFGMNEHRQAISTFDVEAYARYNKDVADAAVNHIDGKVSYPLLYKHYCLIGRNENRRATE